MAFLIKNTPQRSTGPNNPGASVLSQFTQVSRAAKVLPQSTTQILFKVIGGRVLVHYLIGEVTTVLTATDPVGKISSKKLNAALDTAVGTAVDVASTVDIASLEVGGFVMVEGDGTAWVKSNAGCAFGGASGAIGPWIAPNGEIYLTTGASNTTGAMKWDLWYQPLDPGAYVIAVDTATAAV
jgi:hypothetical protein